MDMQEKFHAAKITVGFNFQKISFRSYPNTIIANLLTFIATATNAPLKKQRWKKAIYRSPKTGETRGRRPCK